MKFSDVKTLEHILKEYSYNSSGPPLPSGNQKHGQVAKAVGQVKKQQQVQQQPTIQPPSNDKVVINPQAAQPVKKKPGHQLKRNEVIRDLESGQPLGVVISPKGQGEFKDKVTVQASNGQIINVDPQLEFSVDVTESSKYRKKFKLKRKIKKLARKRLKEADQELFEINFNRKSVASEALDAPIKCGFEAETFWYGVESNSSDDVDGMTIGDIEYEFGDLPDQAYEDYHDWLYQKGQDDYLEDLIDEKVDEHKEDEDYLNDFIDSSSGPSSEAIEVYKDNFKDSDPDEFENREEDGWEYINWVREYVEEEYEAEYLDWLRDAIQEEYDLDDEAKELAEGDYSMDEWVYEMYSYMSTFLDEYGYEYSRPEDGTENVASVLNGWIENNSQFTDYPDHGDYGDTYTTTAWAVERDSSIDPDEGVGAEIISPVFSSPRKMLEEMKSLFEWGEDEFGTNNSTGLHVTMSWQGNKDENGEPYRTEPNKLKMALLLGDQYLLSEFGRLKNSYTKSQYQNVLKAAERMKRGDAKSFEEFEKMLTKGITTDKFQSIHFKTEKDKDSDNELIEFRIAGGSDYQQMLPQIVKAVVRYATIMKSGYDENAFRSDYIGAVSRVLRKSQEVDPEKLKDLLHVTHPVIDSAKDIVGKKDYFDVVNLLSTSVESLRYYQELSKPGADKKWEQSIKDYRKNTGSDPSWMGENINEDEITGYIEPDRIKPSKGAAIELKGAQDKFISAITILSRDVSDGLNRNPVRAKDVGIFRKFANEVKLDTQGIERLILSKLNDFNFTGTDKENIARLKTGINVLFKQDIIKNPEFLIPQEVDAIASKMWQFFQNDDSKDNTKLDKLAELLMQLNPANEKADILDVLAQLSDERAQNGFVAKLRGSGYHTRIAIVKDGSIKTPNSSNNLLKFLEPYKGYNYPTGKQHHINIRSDDNYEEVAKSALVQKMRFRLDHLGDLERDNKEKYLKIKSDLIKIANDFLNTVVATAIQRDEVLDKFGKEVSEYTDEESGWCLSSRQRRVQEALDFLVRVEDEDDDLYNFISAYDDYIIRNQMENIPIYYKSKREFPGIHENPQVKKVVKKNFAGFKKFLSSFDKIFTAEGFTDLKAEISDKNRYDKRNKDFETNIRDNSKAKLNIPSHSWFYIDKDFFETITDKSYSDREAYLDNHLEHFGGSSLNSTKVYVIPSSHWSDAEDATNGLELIDTFEKNKNYYHSWRKKDYRRIVNKFQNKYGFSWKKLTNGEDFLSGDGDLYSTLKKLGIEITNQGDSRKGAPGQDDLVDGEATQNPTSGEPLNRSSAISWSMNTDGAEERQFNAFDWSVYPDKMKDIVAKVMKQDRYGSFKVALEDVLRKVLDGDIDIQPEDLGKPLERLAFAAGVENMDGNSSNSIASDTNWTNLADFLKIERGVNDQGVNLLKKVYDQYDGNHEWRPNSEDGQNVIGLQRWGAAVKAAHEYIQKNYSVSGGNYFRDGDNVSQMYGGSEPTADDRSAYSSEVSEDDYATTRQKYIMFNNMMAMGIQNYIVQSDVNRLVAFLKNPDNDEAFKSHVLLGLHKNKERGEEANDFYGALAYGRRELARNESAINSNMSTIFEKFEDLSFAKQLDIISKIDSKKINEAWSKKYKSSIDCNNPKGFSQKAHCAGKKKKKKANESVPDNTKLRMLNHLLSDHMPANDIKKQMDAFFALPDPKMIKAFRHRRAEGGDDACLRPILRSFIKRQMPDTQRKFINLNENKLNEYEDLEAEKTKIQDIVSKLDIDQEKDRELIDQIWRILNADHIQSVIGKLVVKPIADETAMNKEAATKVLTQVIYQIESSYDKIKEFLDDLEKTGSAYDVDALKQPINSLSNIFKSDVGYTVFKTLLPYGVGANKKGPGEFALAMLSDRVQLSDTTGDVVIDGELVEVKASKSETSSGGGRLGMGGMPQLKARDVLLRYKDTIPSVASHLENENNKTLGIGKFVEYLNQDLPVGDKRRYDIAKDFYKDLFIPVAVEKIAKAFQSTDDIQEIGKQYAGANYIDYLNKGKFEALLAIDMYTGKSAYLPSEEEFIKFVEGPHSGAMGISVVPSNSGPTESFVQMTFRKGKV